MDMMEEGYMWVEDMRNTFSPPPECVDIHCLDMFLELIYTVTIPGGVVSLTAFIFGVCLCCSSRKRRKSLTDEDEIELDKYYTIRRASQSLRDLSHKRDTLILLSRSGSLSYSDSERYRRGNRTGRETSHSAPSTLQRDRRRHREERSKSPSPYQQLPEGGGRGEAPPGYHYVTPEQHSLSSGQRLLPPSNNSHGASTDQQAPIANGGN